MYNLIIIINQLDHINWNNVCNQMANLYHIMLSPDEAKYIWDNLAYDLSNDSSMNSPDSDDELLFDTKGQPFRVDSYFQQQQAGKQFLENRFLAIDYPDSISGIVVLK